MLQLNSLSKNSFLQSVGIKQKPLNTIHFKGLNTDVCDFGVKFSEQNFDSEISHQERKDITSFVKNAASSQTPDCFLGFGANGSVYKMETDEGNSYVVKLSHKTNRNPFTGENQRVNCDFRHEKDILKKVSKIQSNCQRYVADMTLEDGRHALVSTFIEGFSPDLEQKPLNHKNLASLLSAFEELDELGILHRDLKKENIVINSNNEAGLFDFGEAVETDDKEVAKNNDIHNFPTFEAVSNTRNFEDTLLSPYLNELAQKNPKEAKELFKDYLSLKSELIYQKRADLIQKRLDEDLNLSDDERQKLGELQKYQQTMASVLKNPDDEVIACEIMKNQITYSAELAYKNEVLLLNPLANSTLKMQALINAKNLEMFSNKQINKPNTLEKNKYFNYQNQYAKYREQKLSSWITGLTSWLISCLNTPVEKANDAQLDIINQCCGNQNIENFEIPNIAHRIQTNETHINK